jgi:hypothetical protein
MSYQVSIEPEALVQSMPGSQTADDAEIIPNPPGNRKDKWI